MLATLDLSKALDMDCYRTLLELTHGTTVPDNLTMRLANYPRCRQAKTQFRGALSSSMIVSTRVPQSSVLSPTLFNFMYMMHPTPLQKSNMSHMPMIFTPSSNHATRNMPLTLLIFTHCTTFILQIDRSNFPLHNARCRFRGFLL